jgi:predicted outer membrane repeat protein
VDEDANGSNDGNSWEDAFTDLQTALGKATNGYEIWVAEGTYKPTSGTDRSKSFQMVQGGGIYGGFNGTEAFRYQRDWTSNITILSGDIGTPNDHSDNSCNVVKGADYAILDGFTITAGRAYSSGPGGPPANPHGGGMYNSSVSPTVINCTFIDNSATSLGGGMYSGGFLTITNCIFTGNSANEGGGVYNNGDSTLTNCVFTGNSADSGGGGIFNYYSASTLTNSTFTGNSAGGAGGMFNWRSEPTLTNCIIWGNNASVIADEIYNYNSDPNFRYCDVNGCGGSGSWDPNFGTDLGGNIDSDPLFEDPNNDDFHLMDTNSPCIDVGDPNGYYTGQKDIDGDNRVIDIAGKGDGNVDVDMGADEYDPNS